MSLKYLAPAMLKRYMFGDDVGFGLALAAM